MKTRPVLTTLLLLAILPLCARALVIYGDATGHDTDPENGLPWSNVGDNGVFLGSYETGYWVITANHVGASGLTLDGVYYSAVAGSAQTIGTTDLLLYRIDVTDPGAFSLSNLNLDSSLPNTNQPVYMVGDGGDGTMRWGTNTVAGYSNYRLYENGPLTVGLITTYDPIDGEAQGQGGDSGGALFWNYQGTWYLSGILSAIGTLSDNTTQFTASVALGYYYNEIMGVITGTSPIPEPSAFALLTGALAFFAVTLRRPRRRA
jgi:hypothetical protein